MMPHEPLFVIGAPRSGNTLTRRVFMASGQIYIPPETYVFGEILSRWPKWRGLTWREKVFLACAYFDRHPHRDDFEVGSFTPLWQRLEQAPKAAQTVHRFYDELYAFLAVEHGFTTARWGDKTPWNTTYLKNIVKAYPNAYYLYLKRDGVDAVASQVKAGMRSIRDSGQRWIDANNACLKYLKSARRAPLSVSYEELVQEPEAVFRRIFDWAGLEFDVEYLTRVPAKLADVGRHAHHEAVTRPITPASIGLGRRTLTSEQMSELPPGFYEMMQKLSYGAK
ncbi:sulfotransferase [Hyphomonas sp. WL0036]|uniref:sulfotransferase family protein n=1 Tax=Hyphomonas sediminis TaxID=2866160 RepID=UPI001C8143F4|nr:sulfotransferase [Hyphomonas sediminis]MBY9067959.1 sulfotransferase [Hyphomonas sediminis]